MRTSIRNGLLPYGLLCLCFEAILLFSGATVDARKQQQCRLEPRNQAAFHPPTNTGVGATGNNSASGATATAHSTGSSSLPSQTPFNYGKDTIRGVNLYVLSNFSLYIQYLNISMIVAEEDGLCWRYVKSSRMSVSQPVSDVIVFSPG